MPTSSAVISSSTHFSLPIPPPSRRRRDFAFSSSSNFLPSSPPYPPHAPKLRSLRIGGSVSALFRAYCVSSSYSEREATVGDSRLEEENVDDIQMVRVCDKLIEVFMVDKPSSTDWRRLLAFSKGWSSIRPWFFRRCQERADSEDDAEMKPKLLRLGRKLKEIDDDVQRHDELLGLIRTSNDIGGIVGRRRKDFTREFFEHLHTVTESYHDSPAEQSDLMELGNTCLAAVQAYDISSENIEALDTAELKFQDIMNSPNLDVACKKIDSLAEKRQLDSALMLMLTKAWSGAKESSMMKDEVKDVLYHLYMTARGNLDQLVPKEIRILKHILTLEDPAEQMSALEDAFSTGESSRGAGGGVNGDSLYTTPEDLFNWIGTVVDSYRFSREGSFIREARDLMDPGIIQKLVVLQKVIQDQFM